MMQYPDKFPVPLIIVHETDSTNNSLQALCDKQQVEEFTTVISDYQTAGRGQRGNTWEAEDGQNLLFSFVLYPHFIEAKRQFLISQAISLAIRDELSCYTDEISIKWPNDIYWKKKKICGMLIENDLSGKTIERSILGIGININQQTFVSNAPNPVSLQQITNIKHNRLDILRNIVLRFKKNYNILQNNDSEAIVSRYVQAIYRKKGMFAYQDIAGKFMAEFMNIEPGGQLLLRDNNHKMRRYSFKEVQYI